MNRIFTGTALSLILGVFAIACAVKSTDDDTDFLCRLNQIRFSSTP